MPELPEVETICRTLAPLVEGRRFGHSEVWLPRLIKAPVAREFAERLAGQRIERLQRRGKYLLFVLSADVLVVHLRMTGRLQYVAPGAAHAPQRHDRLRLGLQDGASLVYNDVRTFGTFHLLPPTELGRLAGLAALGPEPLEDGFTTAYLQERLGRSRSGIKSFLLRQDVVAGLGNIYADESLFLAGIHPKRPAASVGQEEIGRLHGAIRQVLRQGIDQGGTSIRDYRDGLGRSGGNQRLLCVYGRGGEPCPRCGTAISRAEFGGRGTHWCSRCQPEQEERIQS